MGTMLAIEERIAEAPAEPPARSMPAEAGRFATATLSGVRASEGRESSNSFTSSISSMGVMPQMASGEKC